MDYNQIRALLDKYWKGESSVREEAQLRDFFSQDDIPEDLKPFQPLFMFFASEQEMKMDESFDEKLFQKLDSSQKPGAKIRRMPYYLLRIAAAVLLLVSVYFVAEQGFLKPGQEIAAEEEMTPEEVYAHTKEALLLVSAKMNKGTSLANTGMSKMAKATSVIK